MKRKAIIIYELLFPFWCFLHIQKYNSLSRTIKSPVNDLPGWGGLS